MDSFMAAIVLFVAATFFAWFLPVLPGFDDFGASVCTGLQSCDLSWLESGGAATGATYWVSIGLASGLFLLVSGAFSRSRRSPGMVAAGTYPVLRTAMGGEAYEPPGWLRMLARWALVLGLFGVGTAVGGSGWTGIGLVTLAWLPSLFGHQFALYDLATGTGVAKVAFVDTPAGSRSDR